MTDEMMSLRTLVEKTLDADVLREMIGCAAERLIEMEVGGLTGAGYGEKSPDRLAVEPQQVVLVEGKSADGCFGINATVRSMPIIVMEPPWELLSSLGRVTVWPGICPFTERGLDEAFGLSIGFGRVGFRLDVAQAELLARIAEVMGFVTGAVVCHDACDGDTHACVMGDRSLQEGDRADGRFVRLHLNEGQPRSVVDTNMGELPAETLATTTSTALAFPVSGYPMSNAVDAAEFFDVDVDQFAGMCTFVTTHRLGRIEIAHSA